MTNKKLTKRSLTSEMDKSVKRMLKLIEEDGDSFAKKAEMYYQKRPELISHVEDFYRMYRSLAERYDHVTGELRKNIPLDLQSQSSGISDFGSELPSTWPSPDQRLPRRKSSNRAPGFDFFLGSGGNSYDNYQKEGDESSTLTDSEPESDDSSVNNYSGSLVNGGDQGFQRKTIELEIELREVKEKLRLQQEENVDGSSSSRGQRHENSEDYYTRITGYEQELRVANEKIQDSEEEITRLKIELQRYKLSEFNNVLLAGPVSATEREVKMSQAEPESEHQERLNGLEKDVNTDSKVRALVEELRITKDRLLVSENEINSLRRELERNRSTEKIRQLQDQLELAQKDVVMWKNKLNAEKREVSKLQERITRLKSSLSDRDHEIRDLKTAVSDAEQKIFPEKSQVKAEISRLLKERTHLEGQLREWECRGRSLEEDIRKIRVKKTEMEERLNSEIEHLKNNIEDRSDRIETLNKSLDGLKIERDDLNAKVQTLEAEVSCRDDMIDQMDKQLQQLHREHQELIAKAEGSHKLVEEMKSRTSELEGEIERQKVVILEGAEEKREVIRQLCFSIEHYRNGYYRLRKAVQGHRRVPVLAS
ncbi:hypothetical protein FNV43_RR05240 [Rhamnella rubrinervis]|uniref:NAB domain-containing protein n=1 Tax=Rhamnella rubrinervis TaxID=2594499 RepID=A0A8K0MQH1_9ROSA|nr:hypothetical protein FNV43_RR05240 [Rhamnella rubrinervis]